MQSSSELESALFCLFIVAFFGVIQLIKEKGILIVVNIYVRCYYIKCKWWFKKVLKIKPSN